MHVLNRYLHYVESDANGLVKQGKENVSKLYLSKYRMHLLILPHFHSRDDNIVFFQDSSTLPQTKALLLSWKKEGAI